MNNNLHHLLTTLKRSGLSKDEKETLRNTLIGHINGTSPLTSTVQPSRRQSYRSSSLLMTWRYHVALASFLIVATGGTGIVSAAERSLPGDMLYSIKTRFSEPVVRLVKATTPASSALFETHLLEKRLLEAEQLDSRNALSSDVKDFVKTEVITQRARAEEAVRSIALAEHPTIRTAKLEKNADTSIALSARKAPAPEEVTFSLAASAPADTGTSTTVESGAVQVETTSLANTAVEGDVIVTEEFASDIPALEKVYEKHRLILDKLEVKLEESMEESPF